MEWGHRDVWAGLQSDGRRGNSINQRRHTISLPLHHLGDVQTFDKQPSLGKDSRVSGTRRMGGSSAYLFTSRGTPASSDASGISETEDDCSIPSHFAKKSRCCPCCYRLFSNNFYLFGHLKHSKCKMLCGERGCETPIESMQEVRMCNSIKHWFHCQRCERQFKSWGGLQRHLFTSGDCFKRGKYSLKGRGVAKPQVNRHKPNSEPGAVSPDTSKQSEDIFGIFPPETSQGTALVEGSDLHKETAYDSDGNYGRFDVRWETLHI